MFSHPSERIRTGLAACRTRGPLRREPHKPLRVPHHDVRWARHHPRSPPVLPWSERFDHHRRDHQRSLSRGAGAPSLWGLVSKTYPDTPTAPSSRICRPSLVRARDTPPSCLRSQPQLRDRGRGDAVGHDTDPAAPAPNWRRCGLGNRTTTLGKLAYDVKQFKFF
ncbi:hypothetical protein DFH07DRAFT_260221 [Mycena maculata]|uniref:Uncharacterized protein n=1 Tax=Mycena maculata TaxID=230809 RepID=A0AAD7JV39_9AGAR|nr:hypothetical protein DFH07DRAFT_260221 [Mycena maculata]